MSLHKALSVSQVCQTQIRWRIDDPCVECRKRIWNRRRGDVCRSAFPVSSTRFGVAYKSGLWWICQLWNHIDKISPINHFVVEWFQSVTQYSRQGSICNREQTYAMIIAANCGIALRRHTGMWKYMRMTARHSSAVNLETRCLSLLPTANPDTNLCQKACSRHHWIWA